MSTKLPLVSGQQAIRAFEKIGYRRVRQRGSHVRLRDDVNPDHPPLTVPMKRQLKPGLLRKLLRDANLTVAEFVDLLR